MTTTSSGAPGIPRSARRPCGEGAHLLRGRDYIDYLYEQLNPGGHDPEIARLSGGNRDAAETIVTRFSPHSEPDPGAPASGLESACCWPRTSSPRARTCRTARRVLNYDLHWNPVRLIQRFGRVDRIGTEHDVIDLHSMWPDFDVDAGLEFDGAAGSAHQSFHDLIGLDNRLLSEAERLNPDAMYRIYGEKRLPESNGGLDEVAAHQRAVALLPAHPGGRPGTLGDDHDPAGRNPVGASRAYGEADAGRRRRRHLRAGRDAGGGRTGAAAVPGEPGSRAARRLRRPRAR